jgi:hypothetical protein
MTSISLEDFASNRAKLPPNTPHFCQNCLTFSSKQKTSLLLILGQEQESKVEESYESC